MQACTCSPPACLLPGEGPGAAGQQRANIASADQESPIVHHGRAGVVWGHPIEEKKRNPENLTLCEYPLGLWRSHALAAADVRRAAAAALGLYKGDDVLPRSSAPAAPFGPAPLVSTIPWDQITTANQWNLARRAGGPQAAGYSIALDSRARRAAVHSPPPRAARLASDYPFRRPDRAITSLPRLIIAGGLLAATVTELPELFFYCVEALSFNTNSGSGCRSGSWIAS